MLVILTACVAPAFALAQDHDITLVPSPTEPPNLQPTEILRTIITWLFGFIIVVVVLMTMISAYMFVTAGGSPEKVGQARNYLMYALIGLAIAVLARGLVVLVLQILGFWD